MDRFWQLLLRQSITLPPGLFSHLFQVRLRYQTIFMLKIFMIQATK